MKKPFSEMTKTEQLREAHAAIERLSHPHNKYSPACHDAIVRWRKTIARIEGEIKTAGQTV